MRNRNKFFSDLLFSERIKTYCFIKWQNRLLHILYNFLSSLMISPKQFKFMLVKLSSLQSGYWELLSSPVSIHYSLPSGCLQQLDITKGNLIKSKQTLQINISFSICVIRVEFIDDWRIATSSRLLHITPLSRLLFMSVTIANRSFKSENNIFYQFHHISLWV